MKRFLTALSPFLLLLSSTASVLSQSTLNNAASLPQWGSLTLFHGLPSDQVSAITQDHDGLLWFGTSESLVRYDGRRLVKVQGLPTSRILALTTAPDGSIWAGTESGAFRILGDDVEPVSGTSGLSITGIDASHDDRIMLVSAQGTIVDCRVEDHRILETRVTQPDGYPLTVTRTEGEQPLALTSITANGKDFLIGSNGRGILVLSNGELKELLTKPRIYFVQTVAVDSTGQPWFGSHISTRESGLFRAADILRPTRVGTGLGSITCIRSDGSDLWIGTENTGLYRLRGSTPVNHFTFENTSGGLRSNRILSAYVDREGVCWGRN